MYSSSCLYSFRFIMQVIVFTISSLILLSWLTVASSQTPKCPCSNSSYCLPVTKIPDKELVAFYGVDGTTYKNFNWTRLTTIVVFTKMSDEFLCYAHSRNVRLVTLVFVSQNDIPKLLSKEFRSNVIQTWLSTVQENFMDGINIDIEDTVYSPEFNEGLVNLTKEANAAFKAVHKQYQVTWDVPYSPRMLGCITGWCYDFHAIAESCDFLIVMSYDATLDILTASANSPLQLIEEGYHQYIEDSHVDPDKLVMAVPWYGYDYTCRKLINSTGHPICVLDYVKDPPAGTALKDTRQKQKTFAIQADWDEKSKTPYFTYMNQSGVYHQCWYDDVTSLTFKYKFAVVTKLHGIGMFEANNVDYVSTDPEVQKETRNMWNTITDFVTLL